MTDGEGPELKEVLKELDATMDDLIGKMRVWEGRLKELVVKGDEEALVKEAGKGGYFDRKVTEVRKMLEEACPENGDTEGQVGMTEEELEAELERRIEKKCDDVTGKVEGLIDEISDTKAELKERLKRSMEGIEDLEVYFDPEGP